MSNCSFYYSTINIPSSNEGILFTEMIESITMHQEENDPPKMLYRHDKHVRVQY